MAMNFPAPEIKFIGYQSDLPARCGGRGRKPDQLAPYLGSDLPQPLISNRRFRRIIDFMQISHDDPSAAVAAVFYEVSCDGLNAMAMP